MMRTHESRKADRRRRGTALVSSVVIVMLAASMGAAMLEMQAGASRRQRMAVDNKRALYVAEAGLSEGFLALSKGMSGNVASSSVPAKFGDGVYWVEAQPLAGGKVALVSNGLCGSGRFSIAAVLQKEVNGIASLGIFGDLDVTLGGSSVIDGYDSMQGSFASQAHASSVGLTTGAGAAVRCNANIRVNGPAALAGTPLVPSLATTTVFGDANPGPTGAVVAQPGTSITGSTAPCAKPQSLPEITPPVLNSSGTIVHEGTTPRVITNTEVRYDTLRVRRGAKVILRGPLSLVAGSLIVDGAGQLEFDTAGGPVTVFVTDYLNCAANSQLLDNSANPRAVALLVAAEKTIDRTGDGVPDPPVTLASTGTFFGTAYAPKAAVTLPGTLRVYGSVAARQLTLAPGARLSFDRALLTCSSALAGVPQLISWKVAELPNVPLVQSRRDPLVALAEAAIAPVRSADAAAERNVNITYTTAAGAVRTYNGPVSGLDFSTVKTVLSKVWY